jgi:hypothetical protein
MCVGSDSENVYLEHKKAASMKSTMSGYFLRVSELEKEMFSWISFIVMKNLPALFFDCIYTRHRFLEIKKHLSEINDLLLMLPNHLEVDILIRVQHHEDI